MSGARNLDYLLQQASPALDPEDYVFVSCQARYGDHADWQPIAAFAEDEGLTLVIPREVADAEGLPYEGVFSRITLEVHSSLEAVGLTAAVAGRLAASGISANVFAAFHHDHVFVPSADAGRAMSELAALAGQ